jgi:formylglycine-generating enzyme required for sulfatase activity
MTRIWMLTVAAFLACADVAFSSEPPASNTREVKVGEVQVTFRKISPRAYKIDYPDFYVLETEMTNRMFHQYLRATKQRKDDTEVLKIVRKREASQSFSSGDVPYSVEDESTIWRDGEYPRGLDDHPVALVTLEDATGFCQWLTKTQPDLGHFRLPTWNEWMIAAYGSTRSYPWGEKWDRSLAHTSYGYSGDDHKTRTEPVKARPKGRTPEGLFGMLGNVSEYIVDGDPTSEDYFNLGARWMGGSFDDGRVFFMDKPQELSPREDYWVTATMQQCAKIISVSACFST